MAESDRTHHALVQLLGMPLTDALLAEIAPSFLVAADGRTVLYANTGGSTQLGISEASPEHPAHIAAGAPGSIRLAAISQDMATAGPRLERLRFFIGMRGIALTALCRRITLLTNEEAVLATTMPQTRALSDAIPLVARDDLQALISAPRPQALKAPPAPLSDAPLQTAPPTTANRTAGQERFVFALDADGTLTRLSPNFGQLVGHENTPHLGEKLADVVTRFDIEKGDQLKAGIASGETWNGITLNWPLGDGRSLVPVEFSALPVLDDHSHLAGFSGFGKCRMRDIVPQFEAEEPETIQLPDPIEPEAEPPVIHEIASVISTGITHHGDFDVPDAPGLTQDMGTRPRLTPETDEPAPSKIVSIKTGQATTGFPGFQRHGLSNSERNAFREIAKALGAKIEGQDETAPDSTDFHAPDTLSQENGIGHSDQDNSLLDEAPVISNETDLLDRLPIGLLVLSGDHPLFVNRTLLDLTGYPDQTTFAARDGARAIFRKSNRPNADTGGINTMVLSTLDGEMVPVDALLQKVRWQGRNATLLSFRRAIELEQGKALRSVALDLKRARTDGDELRAILNTATDGVITLDGDGAILSMNGSAEALFGVYANEAVGEPLISLLHRDSHAEALDYLDGLKRNGVRSVLNDGRDVFGREKKGGRIPLFMTLGRISEEAPPRYCAVLRDLTAWKRAEADLTEARRAAEAASAKKSDFLAKISHEIRTPMNAIIGFSEVMQEERLGPIGNPKYREYLGDIQTSGRHVVSLVNDLLDLAKIEAGRMELDFAATDLNAVVTTAVSIIQPQANSNRILVRTQLASGLPPVVADERAMRQILLNMLSNATRFTEAGGQVIVATALLESGEAVIRIRDTGIGMTTSEIEQALEPFRQVGTRRNTGGTGLGLPLTKALVEANRAAFAIRSTPGEGTLIEVTFPATRVLAE